MVRSGEQVPAVRQRLMPDMAPRTITSAPSPGNRSPEAASPGAAPAVASPPRERDQLVAVAQRSVDYRATRLVNFRVPVGLHDRFRALVRDAEDRHPRLRKQSLTELVIALLKEGPRTADDVAELIRRTRLTEPEEAWSVSCPSPTTIRRSYS